MHLQRPHAKSRGCPALSGWRRADAVLTQSRCQSWCHQEQGEGLLLKEEPGKGVENEHAEAKHCLKPGFDPSSSRSCSSQDQGQVSKLESVCWGSATTHVLGPLWSLGPHGHRASCVPTVPMCPSMSPWSPYVALCPHVPRNVPMCHTMYPRSHCPRGHHG